MYVARVQKRPLSISSTRPVPSLALTLWLLPWAAGCSFARYEARPLDPAAVFDAVELARRETSAARGDDKTAPITLADAARLMAAHGPAVRDAVARFQTARARASVETPLPNPSFELGANLGIGGGLTQDEFAPFVGASWALPLSARRERRDEFERARAELARIDAIATWREQWLALRSDYAEAALAHEQTAARAELAELSERVAQTVRDSITAGSATAADLASFELLAARSAAAHLDARATLQAKRSALAARTGVTIDVFGAEAMLAPPEPPDLTELPDAHAMREFVTSRHPALVRLRAEYMAADRELRLAIAEQYPDLVFGPSFGDEVGDRFRVLGLSIGIELPLFDRNQREIATANARRDEIFVRYESELARILGAIEQCRSHIELADQRHRLFGERITELAERQLDLARRGVAAGATGILRYLDALRASQETRLEALDARAGLLRAWFELERALGATLAPYAGAVPDAATMPPGGTTPTDPPSIHTPDEPAAPAALEGTIHHD